MSTVSVVIPCYNAALWIRETLASVLAQSQPPLEVIVVDDGSTDGSGEIVATEFPEVHLIRIPNGGVSHARNLGWVQARGEWIQFLDADDLIHPRKLEWQKAHLPSQDDRVVFLFSPWRSLELKGKEWKVTEPERSTHLHSDLYAHVFEEFTHLSSGLIRKTWLQRVGGFDEAKPPIEDIDLQLRFVRAGATFMYYPTPETIFFYRRLSHSLSTRNQSRFMHICHANLQMAERFLREDGQLTQSRCELLARHYLFVARYYAEHDRARFEQVVDKMEELVPGFLPREPRSLAFTARVLGYRRAERVAVAYRQMKQRLKRIL